MPRTETLQHGYPIVGAVPMSEGNRIIIADRGEDAPNRYAVWREDKDGYTHGGQYVDDLETAKRRMFDRSRLD